jgi:hypothetical protein
MDYSHGLVIISKNMPKPPIYRYRMLPLRLVCRLRSLLLAIWDSCEIKIPMI